MKISHLILQGVNRFEYFNQSFEDSNTKNLPNALLIRGPNGGGKTTVLKSIANLWDKLGKFLENQSTTLRTWEPSFLSHAHFAGMAIKELLSDKPDTIWIYQGEEEQVERFVRLYKNDHRIGFVRKKGESLQRLKSLYLPPGEVGLTVRKEGREGNQEILSELQKRFVQNRLASRADLPNMILLESERRDLYQSEQDYWFVPEIDRFHWLAQYNATLQREGSIQNYLSTLQIVNQEKYEHILTQVNQLLSDKKMTGFDSTSTQLLVTTQFKQTHSIDLLSSAEKQYLLIISFIMREIRLGSVVLIDEPDLHLDTTSAQNFIHHLKRLVSAWQGQLIISSHFSQTQLQFKDAKELDLARIVPYQKDE